MRTLGYLLISFCLSVGLIACNSSREKDDRDIVICVSNLGFNLPASASIIDPLTFQSLDATTFTQSISYTAFDIYGNSYLHTVYFIKTATDTWLAVFYQNGAALRIQSPTSGSLFDGVELYFDQQGTLDRFFPETVRSERLILSDNNFEHIFEFQFSSAFTTQLDSAFAVNILDWSNCTITE